MEAVTPAKKFADDNYTTVFIINFGAVATVIVTSLLFFILSKILIFLLGCITLNYFDLKNKMKILALKVYK